MKAQPMEQVPGGYDPCSAQEATHVMLDLPGPFTTRIIPVILKGTRKGTGCWSWNGSTEKPTLKPSIATTDGAIKCHTWITDGKVIFLSDCTHELAGQTIEMNEVG